MNAKLYASTRGTVLLFGIILVQVDVKLVSLRMVLPQTVHILSSIAYQQTRLLDMRHQMRVTLAKNLTNTSTKW